MITRGILFAVCFSFSPVIFSQSYMDIAELRGIVKHHADAHYKSVFGEQRFRESVEVTVGNIDPRLRLARCDKDLTVKVQEPPRNPRNITLKTQCRGERRWTVYVPATLDVYADVLVLARSVEKGALLAPEDLEFRRSNIASLGYGHVENTERVVGMELKRPMRPGDVIKLSHLTQPDVVRKGQQVVVRSNSRFLQVETSGVALNNGHVGESIKVKNARSNRVIEARVVAPGSVEIATR